MRVGSTCRVGKPRTEIDGEEITRLFSCGPAEDERRNHGDDLVRLFQAEL